MSNLSMKRVNTAIDAESLYLALAMWMEMFPDHAVEHCASLDSSVQSTMVGSRTPQTSESYRKVGCVLVQENGRLLAINCSRDGVHGLAGLLVKHHDKVKGCSAFISRKPCTYCAKLSVQAGITKVSYPPVEPEYNETRKEDERVEALFEAAEIVQNVFVPQLKMDLVTMVEEELSAKATSLNDIPEFVEKVFSRFWNEEYAKRVTKGSFGQAKIDLQNLAKWFAQIYLPLKCFKFKLSSHSEKRAVNSSKKATSIFDPENNLHQEQIANHMLALAMMTTQHTVEPKTGVGCVIMKNSEILAVGWNDFPSKVIEESFHYATDQERDKKYPFFIHAEQNALLTRNATDVTGSVIFVTKIPCHECTPLVKVAGIETVVLPTSLKPVQEKYRLNYDVFREEVKKGSFLCYETVAMADHN